MPLRRKWWKSEGEQEGVCVFVCVRRELCKVIFTTWLAFYLFCSTEFHRYCSLYKFTERKQRLWSWKDVLTAFVQMYFNKFIILVSKNIAKPFEDFGETQKPKTWCAFLGCLKKCWSVGYKVIEQNGEICDFPVKIVFLHFLWHIFDYGAYIKRKLR